jgi:dienelactone hydrolase
MQINKRPFGVKTSMRMLGAALLLPLLSQAAPVSKSVSAQDACAALERNNSTIRSSALERTGRGEGRVCVVRGEIITSPTSTIHFRVDLPSPEHWNTKLMMVGGGGFDGFVPTDLPENGGLWAAKILGADAAHIADYVLASSDSGHQGRGEGAGVMEDFTWVANNPTALRNHAYEANHTVLAAAVDLSQQFYGKAPSRRYIIGGSNGGRAGLVAAQHYPADYDGILSFEPAISQEGFAVNLVPRMLQQIFSSPDNWLNAAQIALYEKGELAACDELDGLKDGVLSNAAACHYDAHDLLCPTGQPPSDSCLTAGQVESISRIHEDKDVPVTLADGWVGYAGFGRGGESSDWHEYLFGPSFATRRAADYALADQIVKWGITNNPNAGVMTHDPTQWSRQYRALSDEIDATNPDLTPFLEHGGKLIVWYGVSDACVSYRQTARYLDTVKAKLGEDKVRQFLRFYISPATGHSMAGAGASTEPLLTSLENWVEKGQAPGKLVSTLSQESAKPGATRPLCEYPLFPKYKGKGDPQAAASFECVSL